MITDIPRLLLANREVVGREPTDLEMAEATIAGAFGSLKSNPCVENAMALAKAAYSYSRIAAQTKET